MIKMIPKKIYLNYVDESDPDKTWSEEPVSVCDCKMKNREYTDLSQVWHDASEIPEEFPILCLDKFEDMLIYEDGYPECVEFNDISKWAYVKDLLPKGGKK